MNWFTELWIGNGGAHTILIYAIVNNPLDILDIVENGIRIS